MGKWSTVVLVRWMGGNLGAAFLLLVECRAVALREKLHHTQIDLRCSLSPLVLVNPSKKVKMKIWPKKMSLRLKSAQATNRTQLH